MKVAICFSGAIRNFEECAPSLIKYLISSFESPDIFLHMWSFDENENNNKVEYGFKWRKDSTNIEQMLKILKPKKYIIENYDGDQEKLILSKANIDTSSFVDEQKKNYGFNCCSMYWKILKCFELVESYVWETGVVYDLVIRARTDFLWEELIRIDQVSNNELIMVQDRYATCAKVISNDKFFAGNMETMHQMCGLFNHLAEYQKDGIFLEGQTMCEHHIVKMGFKYKWTGCSDTYYKFMERHAVKAKKCNIFIKQIEDKNVLNEMLYVLMSNGYNCVCEQDEHVELYNLINKLYVAKTECVGENYLVKIESNLSNNQFIISTKDEKFKTQMTMSEFVKYKVLENPKIITDFILSLIVSRTVITVPNVYYLMYVKQVHIIDPNEPLIYKYSDRGYYGASYVKSVKKDHMIHFDKKDIVVSRKSFKIINLYKYYCDDSLPTNIV